MVAIEAEVSGLKVVCSENVPEEVNLNIFKEYDIKFKTKELEEKYIKMLG